jgi:glutathione S-transferase
MFKLIGLAVSPWTQRAQWALDVCGIPYNFENYLPGLTEPLLRLRLRQWRGQVSVPVLFAGRQVVVGSGPIARFAAQQVGDGRLGDFARSAPWEALSDQGLCEARLRVCERSLASPAVQHEATEGVIPGPLRGWFHWLARRVFRGVANKYRALATPGAARLALERGRAQLAQSGGVALLGRFSYADIAFASTLEMVQPLAKHGPASLQAWTWPELASEFADLLAWRQLLVEQNGPHFLRGRSGRSAGESRAHAQGPEGA